MEEVLANQPAPAKGAARPRLIAFLGPATLVAVGYMDPGNWATDLEGGARFGYQLLWVLVAANWVAILLQTLATRLGVATDMDLAEACRQAYSAPVRWALWTFAEFAIVACDLAEVVGSAIALNLLFHIPIFWGALITMLDVIVILALHAKGMRRLEATILVLISTMIVCFAIEMWLVQPPLLGVLSGLIPRLPPSSLYIAIGILGATIMPHNLYLHSATVKSRPVEATVEARRVALRYFLVDTVLALHVAVIVNGAILLLSAAVFGAHGIVVTDLREAHRLLAPLLGSELAAILFAVALLCAGQSSTITGTLAGQIVMSGFLELKWSPVVTRLLTRGIALIPALVTIAIYGEGGMLNLLIASQIVLSLQLPFAIVPLIRLTSSTQWMGPFASTRNLRIAASTCAALIIGLNVAFVVGTLTDLRTTEPVVCVLLAVALAASLWMLAYIAFVRLRPIDGARVPRADASTGSPL